MAITALKVYNMIKRKNMTGTIETLASEYIASDGSLTEGTATNHTVYMSPPVDQSSYEGTSLKKENDTSTFISTYGLTFTITEGLKLTFNSKEWTINEVKEYYADDGVVVVYEVGLKQ